MFASFFPAHKSHKTLCLVAVSALLSTLPLSAQPASQPVDLLTAVGGWQSPEQLKSSAAVDGLAVEIRTEVLKSGVQRFRFQGFGGRAYEAVLDKVDRHETGGATWIGRVAEFEDHSRVILSTYGDAVAGYLDTPEGRYEISPRPGGHVLIKIDSSRFGGCKVGEEEEAHEHRVSRESMHRTAESLGVSPEDLDAEIDRAGLAKNTPRIDVAVIVTEKVKSELGGTSAAWAKAQASVAVLDQAFDDSNVNATAALVILGSVSAETVGDTSGDDDGLVLSLYSNGSSFSTGNEKEWYQNRGDLDDSSSSGDAFGQALTTGDFNNDGYEDLAIGIPGEDVDGVSNTGAIEILYGSTSRLTATGSQFIHQDTSGYQGGNQSGDQFGYALASADFDGDGYDDLAVGKPFEDLSGGNNTGSVNVMYGGSNGISGSGDELFHQDHTNTTNETDDYFGYALAAADFNGDGYGDLAIGIPQESFSGNNKAGEVAILYGSSSGLSGGPTQALTQDSPGIGNSAEDGDRFGRVLAAGDFDNDGYDDLVVSATHEDTGGGSNAGTIHVIFGAPFGLSGKGSQTFTQDDLGDDTENNDYFGDSLAVGDFDGNGYDDLVVGAPREGSDDKGKVHYLRGAASGLVATSIVLSGGTNEGKLGYALAAGDFDADGYDDLVVGQPGQDYSSSTIDANKSGSVLVYHGSAFGLFAPGNTFSTWNQGTEDIGGTPEDGDYLGAALAVGDFDGDGDDDLSVAATGEGVSNDVDYFKGWLGTSDWVSNTIRDGYSADLVGLLVNHLSGDLCGSAQTVLNTETGNPNKFYQVTKLD